ncbi:bifunctional tetrahydrofolate synthase/dihydrofolate synthase [Dasania sp. GY-MA-18]|uniref:Dihydrofolate synthase/folylpolyglutamate synthase n=1 Tax=Dasania phycosphaerae TaxID=2950436 RepID=A0A9J6RIX4_9GAMM|nr:MULTISPECIES: bifunctional tetrahydrofolate synthase/dihydrofolate synthase [Dasania]MCR8921723.1 bifunctional tetrahydrofolate synthase/dihydrofolate synthase [Dasania sp. GY-MA-18]MCZ0864151.1 bifunctional tetrahydrofolate synthase/dihydrofolate synthase [Dasania phycosphaerae]MCZ0867879.1 bifunctional tetrahydrofolate synthase/dihydrofolate synthase [Dasania phycosphaerae]
MRFDTLQGWLSWIESCHPSEIELGLERMGQVFQRLKTDFSNSKIITVAGTNGKGSCVAALEHLLLKAGLSVGCYTSPHFIRYNERIKINGQQVDDAALIHSFDNIDQLRGDISLTYFEYGTLAALDIFSHQQLDIVIMEVGLGGRLDASNIVDADIAIVTNIDIDHVDWLGSDKEVIGREKAGIFRAGKIALCGDPQPPSSVQTVAQELGAIFYQRDKDFTVQLQGKQFDWQGLNAQGQQQLITGLAVSHLPFDSVVVAIQACQLLGLPSSSDFYQDLAQLQLTGRFQQCSYQGKQIVLDVAHNPAAAAHLAQRLASEAIAGSNYALLAMMADKDINAILSPLAGSFAAWYVADLQANPRALKASALAERIAAADAAPVHQKVDMAQALQAAMTQMQAGDRLIVFGSFFTVAEVVKLMDDSQLSNQQRRGEA